MIAKEKETNLSTDNAELKKGDNMKYDLIAEFRDGSTERFEYSPKNWNRYTSNNDVVAIVTARTEETVFERVIAHVFRW